MDLILAIARASLILVFAVAALAKLKDLRAARQGLVEFGLPLAVARPGAVALPLVELGTAAALLVPAIVWLGGVAASSLLTAFTAAIAFNLWRGRRPDCRCFGQIAAGPIGFATVARNAVLVIVALLIVAQGPDHAWASLPDVLTALSSPSVAAVVGAALVLAIAVLAWLVFQLLEQNGRLLVRVEVIEAKLNAGPASASAAQTPTAGLPVGAPAPAFQLAGLHGETLTLDALRANGKPVLLVLTDPDCGPCTALLPDLARWQRELVARLTVAFISRRSADANRAKATEHGLSNFLVQEKDEVADAFKARGTPAAVLVSADGMIASPVIAGADSIRSLVAQLSGQAGAAVAPPLPVANANLPCPHCGQVHGATPSAAPSVRVGELAPAITLPDLSGKPLSLADLKGKETLVLFWDPACGFCQQMKDEWKNWEATRPDDSPQPLIVSTSSAEANRAMGLRSPVVLEPKFSVGYSFGASGTPSAVLVDAEGRIGSVVAVGAQAVMALARGRRSPAAPN